MTEILTAAGIDPQEYAEYVQGRADTVLQLINDHGFTDVLGDIQDICRIPDFIDNTEPYDEKGQKLMFQINDRSGDVPLIRHLRNKALYIRADREKMVRFMRRRQLYYLSILCAAGAALLVASCAANEQTYTPPIHKMVGTNSGGY